MGQVIYLRPLASAGNDPKPGAPGAALPPAAAEEGDFPECDECAWAGSDACEECEDADLFEPQDQLAAA